MTQVWAADGRLTPVTVLSVGPCKVVQVKSVEKEGYAAAQVSFDEIKERRATRPLRGHFKKANLPPARQLKEFRGDLSDVVVGQEITAAIFKAGELVDVTGVSKGKGFQGVMKRHHYRGGPATHGSMFHRAPGSIGASSFPSRVWKNKGMPGHMGSEQITTQGLEIIAVRPDDHLIFVKGSVPGSITSQVTVYRSIKKVRVKQLQSTKPVNAAKAGKKK
jgi:large subunit ribosomal protein L3